MKLIGQTADACYHYLILSSMASKLSSSVNGESRELHLLMLSFWLCMHHIYACYWLHHGCITLLLPEIT